MQQQSGVGSKFKMALAASALVAGMALAPAAQAEWYIGANTGPMMIDVSGVDGPTNVGLVLGSEWGVVLGDIGVEAEFTTSVAEGDAGGNGVTVDTQAIYGAFRTAGPIYLIAKAGYINRKVEVDNFGSDTDSGGSLGIGIGFSLALIQIELQVAQVDEDTTYASVGVKF